MENTKWDEVQYTIGPGPAARAAIGLLTLSNDLAFEPEVKYFLETEGVALYSNRLSMDEKATLSTLKMMEPHITSCAKGLSPLGHLHAVSYGCTAGSMVIGPQRVKECINKALPNTKATNPISAVCEALKSLSCRRIAVLTPYIDAINQHVSDHLQQEGFELVSQASFNVLESLKMALISPDSILKAGLKIGSDDKAEALFISCTAMFLSPIRKILEDKIGKPVVTSNQAIAWHCLRLAGIDDTIKRAGPYLGDKQLL